MKTVFEELNSSIIQSITNFLTPQDISRMAMTSRHVRLLFGKEVESSFKLWKSNYSTKKQLVQSKQCQLFVKFEAHLNDLTMFENKDAYARFIQLASSKNNDFYSAFFSTVFNKQTLVNPKATMTQKAELTDQRSQIIESLQNYRDNNKIPTYKIQSVNAQSTTTKPTQKIFDFVYNLLKIVLEIQSIPKYKERFQKYRTAKIYISKNKQLERAQYNQEYMKPIVYFNSRKYYHTFMRFNANSVVFSFLTPRELLTLKKVDRSFSYQVDNYLPLMLRQYQLKLDDLQALNIKPEIERWVALKREADQYQIQMQHLSELKAFRQPPALVSQLIRNLMQVLEGKSQDNFRQAIASLSFNRDFLNKVIGTELIDFNEEQFNLIEPTLGPETKVYMQRVSLFCFKVYLFLNMNVQMKKLSISKEDVIQYQLYSKQVQQITKTMKEIYKLKPDIQNTIYS